MRPEYIVVQAGGKGTRLGYLTANRPKAIVPVENLPILFHLFRKYPDKKYIIIGDYKEDVLRRYLAAFADVTYLVVSAGGETGTCAGIPDALAKIPEGEPFLLIWSDLILPEEFALPDKTGNYLGLSRDFPCRWSYREGKFEEVPSEDAGVAGFFVFQEKSLLREMPQSGEFVRWLQGSPVSFEELSLHKTKEYGLLETIGVQESGRCRPFNRIIREGDRLIKEGIDEQGRSLAVRERAWYRHVEELGLKNIPKIYEYEPAIVMERIDGKNIFEYHLSRKEKRQVLESLVDCLKTLHAHEARPADCFSIQEAYYTKTVERLGKIRDMVPFAREKTITVNGRQCRNVFWHLEELEKRVASLSCPAFRLIHGDCTFSNMLLRQGKEPVLIDPRGYFGHSEIFGDPLYDWAKLYYSLYGNYDQFNLRRFRLEIGETEVKLEIESNQWGDMQEEYLAMIAEVAEPEEIKLIHAIIWLSLTTYAWEDYDSVCGAFYNGLYYLEEVL
ncbi:MAG: phosphotransferase [Lachnospiraceae bacterium]|nr:phosphotransferase [Lachnospiraceae bacterium]